MWSSQAAFLHGRVGEAGEKFFDHITSLWMICGDAGQRASLAENAETISLFLNLCRPADRIQDARRALHARCQWPFPVILSIPRSQHLTAGGEQLRQLLRRKNIFHRGDDRAECGAGRLGQIFLCPGSELINFMGTPPPGLRTHPMNQSIPFQCKQMRTNGVPGQPKAKSDFPDRMDAALQEVHHLSPAAAKTSPL